MGLEILTLGSSKTYTRESLLGGGAVVGKNVTISSITPIEGGNRITFSYTLDNGTVKTSTMDVMDGKDGIDGTNGTNGKDGQPGKDGTDGVSPTVTVTKEGKIATITCTDVNGTTTATIKDGEGSEGGEANVIDSISVNGVNVAPDENKNVDITVPSIEGLTKDADLSTVAKSGSYEDLINKPTIPDITGLATETYVDNKVADYTKTVDLADVATSGSYNDLADKPTIPSLDGYAKTTEIPSKVSQLENDSNYLSSIPEEYVTDTELEAKGYLTEHQDISGKVDKVEGKSLISDTEIARLASVDNYDDTAIKAEIAKKANTSDIPTKVSELHNDSKYQTDTDVTTTLTPYATKTYVEEQISNADHLKREIVTEIPDASTADEHTIYMLKIESATGNDKYREYLLIDGTVQCVGDTSVDLTDYAKTADIDNKLDNKADKTEIPTFTNKTVLDGITAEKVADWDEAVTTKTALEAHTNNLVFSETGVHGMRYFNDTLQVQNAEGEWVDIETGGGGIALNNVSDINLKTGNTKLTISWSDPSDTIIEGQTLFPWKGTKLVQKVGSFPENPKDGTLLLDNQTRDKYKTNGFEITGLTNGETYYFSLFPYSDTGATNLNSVNRISGTPQPYRTMTAVIDLTNSNPLSAVTYADDAVGMTKGSEDWDEFLGYYPVLLDASGNELGKLNPNNYAQYEDGTSAPINVLGSYDVMVAFPKRGLKISTENNKVTVSMTDDPDNADFKYYAHSYGAHNNCDVVYVGAYKASANDTKLYSCSGQSPLVNQTIGTFRTYANNRGEGYEQMTFYVRTFLCCAYILRFGNLNSQAAVGRGFVDGNSAATTTGQTDARGMNWGETTGKYQSKCLGIEDMWGNVHEWIDGIFSDSVRNILTAIYNKNMNDTGSGYQNNGQGATADIGNYMSKPQGTTETGFVAKEVSGSATTYFCDHSNLYASRVAYGGALYGSADATGVFRLDVLGLASGSWEGIGGRLIKFKVAA